MAAQDRREQGRAARCRRLLNMRAAAHQRVHNVEMALLDGNKEGRGAAEIVRPRQRRG